MAAPGVLPVPCSPAVVCSFRSCLPHAWMRLFTILARDPSSPFLFITALQELCLHCLLPPWQRKASCAYFPQSLPLIQDTNLGVTLSLLLHRNTSKISIPCLCQPITVENAASSSPLPPSTHSSLLHIKGNRPTLCWRGSCLEVWLAFPAAACGGEGRQHASPWRRCGMSLRCIEAVASTTSPWLSGLSCYKWVVRWLVLTIKTLILCVC